MWAVVRYSESFTLIKYGYNEYIQPMLSRITTIAHAVTRLAVRSRAARPFSSLPDS